MENQEGLGTRTVPGKKSAWWLRDRLLLAITVITSSLVLLSIVVYTVWGSGPVLAVLPWFNPLGFVFMTLASISLAFLIHGRYQVQNDPFSYWIGIGFATHSVGLAFYVMAWPGLLPDGRSFIAQLPNTAGFLVTLAPTFLTIFTLAAHLVHWPNNQSPRLIPMLGPMAAWCLFFALLFSLIVSLERYLPVMIHPDGSYSLILLVWNAVNVLLLTVSAVLAIRYYQRSQDVLAAYIVFALIALIFAIFVTILGQKRYDLWWYLARVILMGGYSIVLFGLLSQYFQLFRQVRDSEARYRLLTESLPQLIWTCSPDGQCNYLSPQWLSYTGIPEKPQLNNGWLEQIHPEDIPRVRDTWTATVAAGATLNTEFRLRSYEGTFRWFKSIGLPIRDSAGQITQWFGSCTDIEDQKQAEEALVAYALDLERSNRDLQEFAFVTSHDLQEPMRKIETFSDLLLEKPANLNDLQLDILRRMQRSARRMRSMVDGLLQLSRLGAVVTAFQPIDLNQVVREVLSDLTLQVRRTNAAIEVCNLPAVEADPVQIRRLLQNLIVNGLKFQPPGGTPHITICSTLSGTDWVEIQVTDNGIGFEQEHAVHLFEPFKRLVGKAEYDGNGIGLAICRKIVELHTGKITARSHLGQGTTFIITLPVRQNQPAQ